MKILFAFAGLLLIGLIAWFFIARPTLQTHFGPPFNTGVEAVEVTRLLDKPAEYLKKEVRIEGTVVRQCPNCACWFVVKDAAGRELKIEVGDIAEPLPYRPGKRVTVEGQLIPFGTGVEFLGNTVEFH